MDIHLKVGFAVAVLLLQVGIVGGAVEADFHTDRGTVTVVLESEKAPIAVENLITLAEGTRSFRDARTGAVHRNHIYDGMEFDEVGAELATVGVADLGYFFPDEFRPSLTHDPYVLTMSNEGPNTNGGRIQFTGNVTITDRDYRNTVFGKIPGAASRQVVDNILLAGSGGTTLLSVKIRRPDSGALAFDEMDVGLPIVSGVEAPLNVRPGKAVDLLFRQPAVSILRTKSSSDLAVWTDGFLHFVGIEEPAAPSFLTIDMASRTKAFYQLSLVKYTESPTAGGASTFAGRTLTADRPGVGQLIYQFDQTGLAGTYENI